MKLTSLIYNETVNCIDEYTRPGEVAKYTQCIDEYFRQAYKTVITRYLGSILVKRHEY